MSGPKGTMRIIPDAPGIPAPGSVRLRSPLTHHDTIRDLDRTEEFAAVHEPASPEPEPAQPAQAFDPRTTQGYADETNALEPADKISDLVIDRLLSRGGIGEVYVATNPVLNKKFALKILSKRYQTRADVRKRMEVEARALAEFPNHDGIVKVYAAGVDPKHGPFIVMELLEGNSLGEILQVRGALGVPQALMMAAGLANIAEDFHQAKITHRDLKPHNVFVVPAQGEHPNRLKVLDFGCIKSKDSGKTTDRAHAMGTTRYMSPEHLNGGKITPASDQVALGHMLYEMIVGEHAFEELRRQSEVVGPFAEASWQLFATILPPPESICPPRVWEIIARLLAKAPEDRFPSMRAAAEAIEDYLREIVQHRSDEVIRGLIEHPQLTPRGTTAAPKPNKPLILAKSRVHVPEHVAKRDAELRGTPPAVTGPRMLKSRRHPQVGMHDGITAVTIVTHRAGERLQRFVLADGATLGRDRDEVDIAIDDASVSRKHAALQLEDEGTLRYAIGDLGSFNGTEVGGERVKYSTIQPGEFFSIGDIEIQLLPPGGFDVDTNGWRSLGSYRRVPADKPDPLPPPTARSGKSSPRSSGPAAAPAEAASEDPLTFVDYAIRATLAVSLVIGLALAYVLLARAGILPALGFVPGAP